MKVFVLVLPATTHNKTAKEQYNRRMVGVTRGIYGKIKTYKRVDNKIELVAIQSGYENFKAKQAVEFYEQRNLA